jgi:hypothetical protein
VPVSDAGIDGGSRGGVGCRKRGTPIDLAVVSFINRWPLLLIVTGRGGIGGGVSERLSEIA